MRVKEAIVVETTSAAIAPVNANPITEAKAQRTAMTTKNVPSAQPYL
jgi:hypothetical protein